ncbi:PREDICTED: uncharacterized protein LOC108560157 [Nicrophorus vespilloides]|uniref:Uncharacterized protein LOC108560157 n=1 Tax=Nicrophorus vespilloides TaxID=110193 RepID=A0ABM1MEU2_NICVS|nr:PREDICTED: uncharacterized protein LOC108560157 [Nicrophorus vespilloides]
MCASTKILIYACVCWSTAAGFTLKQSHPVRLPVHEANPEDPKTFIRSDGSDRPQTIVTCPKGFRFNANSMKCVRAAADEDDGWVNNGCPIDYMGPMPFADDCTKFVNCWLGRGYLQDCPSFLVYRHEKLSCDWPDSANCCEYWEKDTEKLTV